MTDIVYVTGFGDGGFGSGTFGGSISVNNITDAVENWENDAAIPHKGSTLYDLLEVLISEYYRLDLDIDDIEDAKFVQSASGEHLDKLGHLVNVTRKFGETDDKYRKRVTVGYAIASASTTFDNFATIVFNMLDADTDDLEINPNYPAKVTVKTFGSTIDDNVLTESEIVDLLSSAVPAGHDVTITKEGTFEFSSSSYTPPSGTGFGEGSFGTVL